MPRVLKILTAPDKVLTTPAKKVKKIDNKVKKLIEDMIKTLKVQDDPPGVGLAANQVGEPLSFFILWADHRKKPKVIINPKIIKSVFKKSKKGKKKRVELEGCLSIPRIWGEVERAEKVYLEYTNEKGERKKEWFKGLEAIVVQHEVDHLNGILFTARAIEQGRPLFKEEGEELKKIDL